MYGDTFMVPVKTSGKYKPFYAKGTWCSIIYFPDPARSDPSCFTSIVGGPQTITNKFFFAKDGFITPLQDPEGLFHTGDVPVRNSHDLIDIPVDLHIIPTKIDDPSGDPLLATWFSTGQILYYNDESDSYPYCYVEMIHRDDTITFVLTEGRYISDCANYAGFKIGTIIIYNTEINPFPYSKLIMNGNTNDVITGKFGGLSKSYLFFDLT
jgi:hypothetical protein